MKIYNNKIKEKRAIIGVPFLGGMLTHSTKWISNNKAKITAVAAITSETISTIVSGEFNPPEAPSSMDHMLSSPDLVENKLSPESPDLVENISLEEVPMAIDKFTLNVVDMWEFKQQVIPVDIRNSNLSAFDYIMPNSVDAPNHSIEVLTLATKIPQEIKTLADANLAVININTIVFIKAIDKNFELETTVIDKINLAFDSLGEYYQYSLCYQQWLTSMKQSLGNPDFSQAQIQAKFIDIKLRHKEYFERLEKRLSNVPTIGNETTNVLEIRRDVEKLQERFDIAVKNYQEANLLAEIASSREEVNAEINTIINRSTAMFKYLTNKYIPSLEKLLAVSEEKLAVFKVWVKNNRLLSIGVSVSAAIGAMYYLQKYSSFTSFAKITKKVIWGTEGVTKKLMDKPITVPPQLEEDVMKIVKQTVGTLTPKQATAVSATAGLVAAGVLKKVLASLKK